MRKEKEKKFPKALQNFSWNLTYFRQLNDSKKEYEGRCTKIVTKIRSERQREFIFLHSNWVNVNTGK